MGSAPDERSPDAVMRVAAGAVVPVVAVAAHGLGSGTMPGMGGIVLTSGIGILVGVALGGGRRRSATAATIIAIAALTVAQIGAHVALTVGQAATGMHHDAVGPMVLTHLVAIPVSAVLLVAAAGLLGALTSTIRGLSPLPRIAAPAVRVVRWDAPDLVTDLVVGGVGVRGPPALR